MFHKLALPRLSEPSNRPKQQDRWCQLQIKLFSQEHVAPLPSPKPWILRHWTHLCSPDLYPADAYKENRTKLIGLTVPKAELYEFGDQSARIEEPFLNRLHLLPALPPLSIPQA